MKCSLSFYSNLNASIGFRTQSLALTTGSFGRGGALYAQWRVRAVPPSLAPALIQDRILATSVSASGPNPIGIFGSPRLPNIRSRRSDLSAWPGTIALPLAPPFISPAREDRSRLAVERLASAAWRCCCSSTFAASLARRQQIAGAHKLVSVRNKLAETVE